MSDSIGHRNALDLTQLEDSIKRCSAKLRKLQRFWIPLQKHAPRLVLSLWIIGVVASLFTQCYYHWLFMAPAICVLIVLEMVIEEVQTDLLLMTAETRYLIDLARGLYAGQAAGAPATAKTHRPRAASIAR